MALGLQLRRPFYLLLAPRRNYSPFPKRRNPYLNFKSMSSNDKVTSSGELFQPLVWIDCEMTGLDHTKDKIIEICCIITDGHLNIVGENCYESVIHYGEDVMKQMNEWCIDHHGKSGLTKKVLESTKPRERVEGELLQFIQEYIPQTRVGVLAGNSVHMDRLFMLKDFPKVIDHLFYRIVDVSSLMEISFRHNPALASVAPKKEKNHTAKSDILESIEQLRWYREHYLKSEKETGPFVKQQELLQEQEQQQDQQENQEQPEKLELQQEQTTTGEKRPTDVQHPTVPKSRKT